MRVLIIGGTGFIGPYVLRHLVGGGHNVAVFHRGQTPADLPSGVTHIYGDRRNFLDFVSELTRFAPEVVLDMFPFVEQDARMLVQTFRGIARRVVAISSMDVYRAYALFMRLEDGLPQSEPFDENSPMRSRLYPYRASAANQQDLAYSYEKILVEQVVMGEAGLPGTVLRLPQVYGPGDVNHRLFEHLKHMQDGRPCILLEDGRAHWRWTRGYVEDVAAAIALAVMDHRAQSRIYNAGERKAYSELEWIERIAEAVGWKGEVRVLPKSRLPEHLALSYDWRHHLVADTSRIRRELGYEECCVPDAALRRTIAWELEHPPNQFDAKLFNYPAEDALSF